MPGRWSLPAKSWRGFPALAVDSELASRPGEPGVHVSLTPMPVPSGAESC